MILIVLATALGLTLGSDLDLEWRQYKVTYSKVYSTPQEEAYRRGVWDEHQRFIKRHNEEAAAGKHSFFVGINQFADMPNWEFQKLMTSGFRMRNNSRDDVTRVSLPSNQRLRVPDTVDWRDKGYVTPIKDQGQCGACWAFSANGALEGQWFKKTGELVPLSEQNLVDCAKNGNLGCEGGHMILAFLYIIDNGGVDTEASYPYEARDGDCRFNSADVGAKVTGVVEVTGFSEDDLQTAVADVGPISIGMDASRVSFQLYRSGVYYDPDCSDTMLNHAVTAVGYGSQGGEDYWIMKNSWGTSWGDQGYVLMARNKDNNCGVATDASYPTV